jgi:hypothetical protein
MARRPLLTIRDVVAAHQSGASFATIGAQFGITAEQAAKIVERARGKPPARRPRRVEYTHGRGEVLPLPAQELCPQCGEYRRLQGGSCRRCREAVRAELQAAEKADAPKMEIRYGPLQRHVLVIQRRDTLLQLTSGIVDACKAVRAAGTVCIPVRELPRILQAVKRLAKQVR